MPRPLWVAASVALVAAALCFGFVAVDRWTPCLQGLDTAPCFARQDDRFDPSVSLSGAHARQFVTTLAAYGLLALGTVLVGLGTRSKRGTALLAIAALLPLCTMLTTLIDGVDGLALPVLFLSPFVGILAAAALWPFGRPGWAALFGVGIGATSLLVDSMVLAPLLTLGYYSHDTNPWTYLPSAIGCLVAGVALWNVSPVPAEPSISAAATVPA